MSVYAYVGPHWSFYPLMGLCLVALCWITVELFRGPPHERKRKK